MHGRLKVRTSAEEAARKAKEQAQKVVAYRTGMTKIFAKNALVEHDNEMIQLTSVILSKNPDISTLWNIRRNCILKILQEQPENVAIFTKDLEFTENCLLVNPKSYCAWHHRCWCLEHSPEPNWTKEVDVCTKYLKMDERNFHVWDYRRYVVEKAAVPAAKELDFCTEKIQKNFSNYSSWHYRSKLLPQLYPHETDKSRPINERVLKEELEMILTAAFTDPNDSSAWFYQRWLLGYSQPELDLAAFKLTSTHAIVAFSKPVDLTNARCSLSLDAQTKFETKHWQPINSTSHYNTIWILEDSFELNTNSDNEFQLEFVDECDNLHTLPISKTGDGLFGIKMPKFGYEFESGVLQELKGQLQSCRELLDYEPDSKWTLLTAALLMRAIDRTKYHSLTLNYLDKLKVADPLRHGYYTDLANKWSIEIKLEEWIGSLATASVAGVHQWVDLSGLDLSTLFYEQYFCVADAINLEGNGQLMRRQQNVDKLIALHKCNVNVLK